MRTIIDLRPDQIDALDRICQRDGISRAEAIRQAVDAAVAREQPARARPALGLWRGRRLNAVGYQRKLRGEWDR